MRVPALVLFTRELRVDVRRKRSHLLRVAFAGVIFIAMISAEVSSRTAGAPGLVFFAEISLLNFAALTLAGVSWFATAVTQDKDEGTFDLLKLAGIGSLGLLLGRSTTRLVATLLILAVQLPFTYLAVTLGGVVPAQVLGMYLSLAAYAVLLANLGLLCSVVSRGSAAASGLAVLLVAVLLAGPHLLESICAALRIAAGDSAGLVARALDAAAAALRGSSILSRISELLGARFSGQVWSADVSSHLVAAVVLFGLSWWNLGRVSRSGRERRSFLGARRPRRPAGIRTSRRVWRRALLWKELQRGLGGPLVQVAKLIVFVTLPAAMAVAADWDRRTFSESLMGLMLLLIAVEASLYAAVVFRSDVQNNTLPQLALLPISTGQIARTKAAAILLALAPGTGAFLLAAALSPEGFRTAIARWLSLPTDWMILLQFLIFLHATAYLSLLVKWGALPLAFVAVFASSYFLAFCCVFPISMLVTGSLSMGPASRWMGYVIPMILVAAAIIVWLQFAIAERLRTLAGR